MPGHDILVFLAEVAVIMVASFGGANWFRYHAVEYGHPRLWAAARPAGVLGAAVSMAVFAEVPTLAAQLGAGVMGGVWFAVMDWIIQEDAPSYDVHRQFRLQYGSGEAWVDAYPDDTDVQEVAD